MRVYLPATLPLLAGALDAGEVGPAPLTAFAVTPALREWYAEGDTEELEYAALLAAARGSLRLLDATPAAPRRRVVLAAEVPDAWVSARPDPDDDRAAVTVSAPVPLARVAAGHVDEAAADAAGVVASAAAAVLAADMGDDDAEFTVSEAEDLPLQWYASQELAALRDSRD